MPSMSEPFRKKIRSERTTFSVTPIEVKSKCFRKWALGWIAKCPKIEDTSRSFGKRAHSMAEAYLRDGTIPDMTSREGKLFVKGVHLLPRPGTVVVEGSFTVEIDGFELYGLVDFRSYDWTHIGDHKFISQINPEWYPITPAKLALNWQANVYALASVIKSHRSQANMNWLWYPKKGGDPAETHTVIPAIDAHAFVRSEILPHCRDMRSAKSFLHNVPKKDLLRVINEAIPCNALHCFDYNSLCDYSEFCER